MANSWCNFLVEQKDKLKILLQSQLEASESATTKQYIRLQTPQEHSKSSELSNQTSKK